MRDLTQSKLGDQPADKKVKFDVKSINQDAKSVKLNAKSVKGETRRDVDEISNPNYDMDKESGYILNVRKFIERNNIQKFSTSNREKFYDIYKVFMEESKLK